MTVGLCVFIVRTVGRHCITESCCFDNLLLVNDADLTRSSSIFIQILEPALGWWIKTCRNTFLYKTSWFWIFYPKYWNVSGSYSRTPFALSNWSEQTTFLFQYWPEHGVVEFNKYSTRYREGLDLVVKDIDCKISGGEKVRIFIFVIGNSLSWETFLMYFTNLTLQYHAVHLLFGTWFI